MEAEDDQVLADDLWLRDKVVTLLQGYIAKDIIGDRRHASDMLRARRVLRRLGEKPITDITPFERVCLDLGVRLSVALAPKVERQSRPDVAQPAGRKHNGDGRSIRSP